MLIMAYSPIKTTAKSVCHLIFKQDRHNPIALQEIQAVRANSSYVVRIGEHILSDARFFSFDHYVLHGTMEKYLPQYLQLLKQGWSERLKRLVADPKRTLIVQGTAVKMLGNSVFVIDREKPYALNVNTMNQVKMLVGLGLINFMFDVPFNPNQMKNPYMRSLIMLSTHQPIYLFDSNAVYNYTTKEVSFGKLYVLKNMKLETLRQLPETLTNQATSDLQNRQVGPAKVFYSEDEMREYRDRRDNTRSLSPEEIKGHVKPEEQKK